MNPKKIYPPINRIRRPPGESARFKCQRTGLFRRLTARSRLPPAGRELIRAMVYGMDDEKLTSFGHFEAREALTLVDACRLLGFDCSHMLQLARHECFKREMMAEIEVRRMVEFAKNIGVAVKIRDAVGDGSPAADAIRLRAIATIEGSLHHGPGPTVQINNIGQQNNMKQDATKPGYIIRLAEPVKTIEHQPSVSVLPSQ